MAVIGRYLALWLPAFRLERCGWSEKDVVILVALKKNAIRVVDRTLSAAAHGITVGESLASARSRVHDVVVEWLVDSEENHDSTELVRAFGAFSDRVSLYSPSLLMLGVSGVAHLYGGESALVDAVLARALVLGHRGSAVVCSDPRAAVALAKSGYPHRVVLPGRMATALSPLPLSALNPGVRLHESLAAVGVKSVGQWALLARSAVAERYGEWGVSLHKLANGDASDHQSWVPIQSDPLRVEVTFPDAVTNTSEIQFGVQSALAELSDRLVSLGESASRLSVGFRFKGASPMVLRLRFGRPTHHLPTLIRQTTQRLQGLRLSQPAISVVLEVEETRCGFGWQPSWTDRAEGGELLPDLLARLGDDLGDDSCFEATICADWRPESAWKPRPSACRPLIQKVSRLEVADPAEHHEWRERTLPLPRPVRLLEKAEAIEVQARALRPTAIRKKGGWSRLEDVLGPERLSGGWWQSDGTFSRDYWVIREPRGVSWIYCEGGGWYRHGWFD